MQIDTALRNFIDKPLLEATRSLFRDSLNIPLSPLADAAISPCRFFRDHLNQSHEIIQSIYLVGRIEDSTFEKELPADDLQVVKDSIGLDYEGLIILAVDLANHTVTRSELSNFTRDFNRIFKAVPVIVVYKYNHNQTCISLASCERSAYRQHWHAGEKPGKVSLLKDIIPQHPHAAHLRFLCQLTVPERGTKQPNNFRDLHKYWQHVFDNRVLNEQFYKEVSAWYHYAIEHIRLPDCPAHFGEDSLAHTKDFAVRLICRLMFCWFLKERGLIPAELLELRDYRGQTHPLVQDSNEADLNLELFARSSSYYRAILQNLFFNVLHTPIEDRENKSIEWYHCEELHKEFNSSLFDQIPFINAALFERDEGDNVSNRSEEGAFSVPNELFYAENITVQRGSGRQNLVATKGLNRIFAQYKFTIEENTSIEEEVALDPEMLGMVFENLLAEIDPNEDGSSKSARKESGAYYTPRRIIDYMVNESLRIHLRNAMGYREGTLPEGYEDRLEKLLYFDQLDSENTDFRKTIVEALDKVKILDPACGSGAFPVGMLNRMVQLLNLVDPENHLWIELQVQRLPDELQEQARRDLISHDNNYPRKVGLIRNAIYGIDIQPMAVMITKLRFFISLLIDQKIDLENPTGNYGMEQLPQMETKVICANSLQNFEPDLIQDAAIADLTRARKRYYQRNLSPAEQAAELDTIITKLDEAFPQFYKSALGHPGLADEAGRRRANRKCLENWFHFGSMAAPFFNLRFFFPEVATNGGFDIVIGNPPYGGTKISNELKDDLGLASKDPYGAFISRFVANHPPLKRHGVLSYIVSDTFMTIKSHKPLREQLLQSFVHRMIRVHPDTFKATVNTAIIVVEREEPPSEAGQVTQIADCHQCLMGDLTQVSIHEHYTRFLQLLYRTTPAAEIGEEANGEVHVMTGENWRSESSPEYALYRYRQNLIRTNSNIPFFVASPKIFKLTQDKSNKSQNNADSQPKVALSCQINNSRIKLYKFGETYSGNGSSRTWNNDGLAKVFSGIKTGNNPKYIRSIDPNWEKFDFIPSSDCRTFNETLSFTDTEKSEGLDIAPFYLPYDMGQSSTPEAGVLPNYYMNPTRSYVYWSKESITAMKAESHYDLANWQFRCKECIVFSKAGFYAPTFRLSTGSILDSGSNGIICNYSNHTVTLGLLCSVLTRFFIKAFINHTVNSQVEDIKYLHAPLLQDSTMEHLVSKIIEKKKSDIDYDYASNEQLEIDRLVYEAYGLNEDDIREVENWYARRYPALAAAQRANLERKRMEKAV